MTDRPMTLNDLAKETERALEARQVIEDIRSCVGSGWSQQTVDSVEMYINKHGLVTSKQLQALKNIREKCSE